MNIKEAHGEWQKPYDLVFYIGRFQPFHVAHEATVQNALVYSENVCVIVGSANSPRTPKDILLVDERIDLIKEVVKKGPYDASRVSVEPLNDYKYEDQEWLRQIGQVFKNKIKETGAKKIAVTGYNKDESSFYLNYFPQFDFLEMQKYPSQGETIDATKIRELLFKEDFHFIKGVVPSEIYTFLMEKFIPSEDFQNLKKEYEHNKNYDPKQYDVHVLTTDAIVTQSGHILLIKRDGYPGNNLWALPGGHLETNEKVLEGVIRELIEETGLKVPEKVLKGSIVDQDYFDDPKRSPKARVLTFAFHFQLDDTLDLPRVKPQKGEALEARWIPLTDFEDMASVMFEDHWHLARSMLSRTDKNKT